MPEPPGPSSLDRLLEADRALSCRIVVPAGPLRFVALLLAHSGDSLPWLVGACLVLILGKSRYHPLGLRALAGMLVGGMAAAALKWLFRRRRPDPVAPGLYLRLDRHALPSGHATRAACTTVLLAPLLPGWGAALLATWAGLVSLARVALQVHYVLDVIVGLALGGLIGLALRIVL